MGNFLDAPITSKEFKNEEIDDFFISMCSMQGWRSQMEDRSLIKTNIPGLDGHHLVAIFDGHGGEEVAEYCALHLLRVFAEMLRQRDFQSTPNAEDIGRLLRDVFMELDQELKRNTFKENGAIIRTHKPDTLDVGHDGSEDMMSDLINKIQLFEEIMAGEKEISHLNQHEQRRRANPEFGRYQSSEEYKAALNSEDRVDTCGSTALAMIVTPTHLVVANTGDSRAILGHAGNYHALSRDHKPAVEEERERITMAGGQIQNYRVNGRLAVSRTMGDHVFKLDPQFPPENQVISCEPEVQLVERTKDDEFVLLACDGIWDVMNNGEAAFFIRGRLEAGEKNLNKVLAALEDECLKKQSRDNMSAILVAFPPAWSPSSRVHPSARYLEKWSVSDVQKWLAAKNFAEYQEQFEVNKIDGKKLLNLTEEDLSSKLRLKKAGLRKKLWEEILPLRRGFLAWSVEQTAMWLKQVGLVDFQEVCRANNIDGTTLSKISKEDLKALTNDLVKSKVVTKGRQGMLLRRVEDLRVKGEGGELSLKYQRSFSTAPQPSMHSVTTPLGSARSTNTGKYKGPSPVVRVLTPTRKRFSFATKGGIQENVTNSRQPRSRSVSFRDKLGMKKQNTDRSALDRFSKSDMNKPLSARHQEESTKESDSISSGIGNPIQKLATRSNLITNTTDSDTSLPRKQKVHASHAREDPEAAFSPQPSPERDKLVPEQTQGTSTGCQIT